MFGQISNSFTALYRDYFIHQNIVNPANTEDGSSINGSLHHKSFLGPLSVIKTYLGNINFRLSESSYVGLQFNSEQEGKFFNRDRFYLLYSSGIELNKKAKLNAGLKIGMVNYSFGASSGSAGGSNSAFDVSFGALYKTENFFFGLSGHQLPNVKVKPIDFSFDLPHYAELNTGIQLKIVSELSYNPSLRIRYSGALDQSILMHSHILRHFKQRWIMGIHHLFNLGISPTIGYSFYMKKPGSLLDVQFSYFVRTSNSVRTNQLTNQYEIGIAYKLFHVEHFITPNGKYWN